jgi:repressor LexA
MTGLTKRQYETMTFIENFMGEKGFSPSYDDIADALHLASKSNVSRMVNVLIERGYLSKMEKRARSFEILIHVSPPVRCPHCNGDLNTPPAHTRGVSPGAKPNAGRAAAAGGSHQTRAP